jgi:hypothetical protein
MSQLHTPERPRIIVFTSSLQMPHHNPAMLRTHLDFIAVTAPDLVVNIGALFDCAGPELSDPHESHAYLKTLTRVFGDPPRVLALQARHEPGNVIPAPLPRLWPSESRADPAHQVFELSAPASKVHILHDRRTSQPRNRQCQVPQQY